jgi:hypothetical protein
MTGMMVAITGMAATVIPPGGGGGGGPLGVVVAPNPARGVYDIGTDATVSEHVIANLTGGVAPFSYLWAYVSGYAGFGITDPTQREVWWGQAGPDHREAMYRVTVTDSLSQTAQALVTVIMN